MEVCRVFIERLVVKLIIDMEIKPERHIVFIYNFDFSPLVERHRQIAVDRSDSAEFELLLRFDGYCKWQRSKVPRHRMADAEKIS
ncbi:hypothetical protein D3C77_592890 [compost metagenome]